jgi:quercetin dioxygenase-like cupin family protein
MAKTMSEPYTLIENLSTHIDIQTGSIVSRTFFKGEQVKAVLFGFDAGQALSEHTSSQPATIQIINGEATITLGDDSHEVVAGAWIHMTPKLKHSVYAKTPLTMLLLMGTE